MEKQIKKIISLLVLGLFCLPSKVVAVDVNELTDTVNKLSGNTGSPDSVKLFVLMTVLTLIPALLVLTTSFTRIIMVLSFVRSSLGTQQTPPNQVLMGIALFLTFFIMQPVYNEVNKTAIQPLIKDEITQAEAIGLAEKPIKKFMLKETREKDLSLFVKHSNQKKVKNPEDFDLAISGEGMFGIRLPDNQLAYTRDGSFAFDQNGVLRNASGNRVEMTLNVPKNNWPKGEPYVREDGQVRVGNVLVGEIPVFDDANSSQLIEVGENQWVLPQGQAAARLANPVIKQHFLEGSNVELAESMSDMIVTQRAYSMNAKVLQATDEMMQRINEYKQ